MDKSTREEHLSQPLQTNNEQIKTAITFLTVYNGVFNVTNSDNKFYFTRSIIDDDSTEITIPKGAYEFESLKNESKRIIFDEKQFTEAVYPFNFKPNFSTLGSFIEISIQGSLNSSPLDDSIRISLGFNATKIYQEDNIYPNTVDSFSSDNIFLDCDISQGMNFKGKRSCIFHNFTQDVRPRYKYIEEVRGGIQWYIMQSKDITSSKIFKLKNENGQLV